MTDADRVWLKATGRTFRLMINKRGIFIQTINPNGTVWGTYLVIPFYPTASGPPTLTVGNHPRLLLMMEMFIPLEHGEPNFLMPVKTIWLLNLDM